MRKLIVSMNITLDGYLAGPSGELDWHFQSWTSDMGEVASEQLGAADTILLGRKTYQAMAQHWPSCGMNHCCSREDIDFAMMMNSYRKIVFSNTLQSSSWNNSCIAKKTIRTEIEKLKREVGKTIITYGSVSIVRELMQLDLVDAFHLWVHPLFINNGVHLFRKKYKTAPLKLQKFKKFESGVVLLCYDIIHDS